jgi:hypothetical protein
MFKKDIYHKNFTQIMQGLWWAIVSGCTRLMRIGFMIGSRRMTFLSGSTFFTPLAGYYGGAAGSLTLYLFRICQSSLILPQQGYKYYLVYHIPSFCAGLYIAAFRASSARKYALGCALPLLCMALFVIDPVGSKAWWYSLYWLIPVMVTLTSCTSRFMQLLGATFVAHAVGTIRWMMMHHMTVEQWQFLVGVVWYERLLAACVMYGIVVVGDYVYERCSISLKKCSRYIRMTL